jgi:hypothetical protein
VHADDRAIDACVQSYFWKTFGNASYQTTHRLAWKYWPDIRACYSDGLARRQSLKGRLALSFRISPDGEVSELKVTHDTLNDKPVRECVVRRFESMLFPGLVPRGWNRVKLGLRFGGCPTVRDER